MKADGSVIIDTKIGTDGMEKGFEAIKDDMQSVSRAAEDVGKKITVALTGYQYDSSKIEAFINEYISGAENAEKHTSSMKEALEAAEKEVADLEDRGFFWDDEDYVKAQANLARIKNDIKEVQLEAEGKRGIENPFGLDTYSGKIREAELELSKLSASGKGLGDADYDEVYRKLSLIKAEAKSYAAELAKTPEQAQKEAAALAAKAAAAEKAAQREAAAAEKAEEKKRKAQKKTFNEATKGAKKFGNRLSRIASSALIFNVISQGLRSVTQYFGKALKSNQKFADAWSKLKGAAITAIQPIYEVLLPILTTAVNVAAKLVLMIGEIFSSLAGKSTAQMKENAEALYEQASATEAAGDAAEEAKKQMAGFDEINTLGDSSSNTESTTESANFELQSIDVNSKLTEMAGLAAAAIFALGIILTLSGVNIPLGLGMIVLGGLALYKSIKESWGSVESKVISTAEAIALIGGAVMLAIGIIICFACPTHLALGLGLVIGGAALLGSEVALNWNAIKEALQGSVSKIMAIISGALLVIGIILCFTGAGIPLGIGMIIAGAAGLATVVAVNWNTIVTTVKEKFGAINEWIQAHGFAMLILGIVLLFSGFAIPVGLALIGLGIKGMVSGKDPLWNTIFEKIKEVWKKIKDFWNQHIAKVFTGQFWKDLATKCGNGLIAGFEGAINGIISMFESMINWVVKGLNKISIDVPDWVYGIGGKKFGFNIPEVKLNRVSIPRLAQGTVIPPNREFMAVLGDQKHGTNIEAPLETIKQALAEVLAMQESDGETVVTINFTGDLAQLARVLKPAIETETRRKGGSLATGGVY